MSNSYHIDRLGFHDRSLSPEQYFNKILAIETAELTYKFRSGIFKGHCIVSVPDQYLIETKRNAISLNIAGRCARELERRCRIRKEMRFNQMLQNQQLARKKKKEKKRK